MYDLVIIGSGPSGLTAAIYATRAGFKVLVVAGVKWGGQLMLTTLVENFPGFVDGVQGQDLIFSMRKQAEKFGTEILEADFPETDFTQMPANGPFKFKIGDREIETRSILIATGADAKTLNAPGELKLTGRGVSYCATCDGAFFRNKNVIVVGGGDSAMEDALFLTKFATSVTIVHRREECRASKIMLDRAHSNPKITFLLSSEIVEVFGEAHVEKVKIKSSVIPAKAGIYSNGSPIGSGMTIIEQNNSETIFEMPIDGVFVAIGHNPNSKVFKGVEVIEGGYVKDLGHSATNIPGVFVSGDVADDHYRQAITAAGFGAQAALDIQRFLEK